VKIVNLYASSLGHEARELKRRTAIHQDIYEELTRDHLLRWKKRLDK
jgi:hypothetical protein